MIRRLVLSGAIIVLVAAVTAIGAGPERKVVTDKLLADQSLILPWIIGVGILAATLIAGFKHPGRTHLD